jgi:putative transposase
MLRHLVDPGDETLTIEQQCDIYGLSRSGYYYKPKPINPRELLTKAEIDKLHTKYPALGYRKIAPLLPPDLSADIHTVHKYMREMGIRAVYPKPNLSKAAPGHKVYPYLLKGFDITRPNQVWSTDITYVPINGSFMYLSAIMAGGRDM